MEHGLDERLYEQLLLVVPPRMLGRLRSCLPGRVANRVVSAFEKDYTALATDELKERVAA